MQNTIARESAKAKIGRLQGESVEILIVKSKNEIFYYIKVI